MEGLKEDIIFDMISNIENKNSILDEVFDITMSQKQSLFNKDIDSFEEALEEKESLFSRLDMLNKDFEDFIKNSMGDCDNELEEVKNKVINSNDKLRLLYKQTKDIVKNIEQVDKENLAEVKIIMAELKDQIETQNKVKKVEQTYYSEFYQDENSCYFDSKK